MSEIDPDIQMPDEEPKSPADQSSPQPSDKTTDVDAEDTLDNMQELIDHIDSLEKESDAGALKEIESRLPLDQDPGEGNASTTPLAADSESIEKVDQPVAPVGEPEVETPASVEDETRSEGVGDCELASVDDDLALLLEDIDQVVVQAVSETSDSSKDENPVGNDAVSETTPEASSAQEETAPLNDAEDAPDVVATDPGDSLEVVESAGLDIDVDEIVAETETLDETVAPSPASEPSSTVVESAEDVEETSLEAGIEAVLVQALNPSPAKPESAPEPATPEPATPEQSTPEQSAPVASVENDTPPDTSDAADTGGVEISTDLSSEIDALLAQVKAEQTAKPPEPKRKPVAPVPETISSAPAGEDSELNDLSGDLDDLLATVQSRTESDEKSVSSESPASVEAIDSETQDSDKMPDIISEATPAESEEPATTPVQEEQKKESTPQEIKPLSKPPLTQQDLALRALDEAMADDVAQLIVGDSDAIEAVLDGIFDEQAILVQNEEDFLNESAMEGIKQSDDPVGDSVVDSGSPSDSPMETASDIGEVIDEEIASLVSPETRQESLTSSVSDLPEADQKGNDQAAQKPTEATKVASAAEAEAVPGEPQLAPEERENKWKERVQAAFEIIEPPLVTVLSGLNYPLRKIPKKLRPAVDWLALSLVFWVPIVWVLAMFVVG